MEMLPGIILTIITIVIFTINLNNIKKAKTMNYEDKYVDKTDGLVVITKELVLSRSVNNTKSSIVFYILSILLLILQVTLKLDIINSILLILLVLVITCIINITNLKTKVMIKTNRFLIYEGTVTNKYTKAVDGKVKFYVETDQGAAFPFRITEEMYEKMNIGDLYYVIRTQDDFQLYDRRKYKLSNELKGLIQVDK